MLHRLVSVAIKRSYSGTVVHTLTTSLPECLLISVCNHLTVPCIEPHTSPLYVHRPVKAFLFQVAILTNHQNGRDTHIRQVKVFEPVWVLIYTMHSSSDSVLSIWCSINTRTINCQMNNNMLVVVSLHRAGYLNMSATEWSLLALQTLKLQTLSPCWCVDSFYRQYHDMLLLKVKITLCCTNNNITTCKTAIETTI